VIDKNNDAGFEATPPAAAASISPERRQFIEDMGLLYEEFSLPPMAGRIIGWLLVSDSPSQSAAELAAVLNASPGSISTNTRILIQMGIVDRIVLPERRGHFYRIRGGAWSELIRAKLAHIQKVRRLAEQGLETFRTESDQVRSRLEDLHDFYAFVERELPALLESWEAQQAPQDERSPR
jgi:DNA-binding transcriptional regulator GbsR (MarR family)